MVRMYRERSKDDMQFTARQFTRIHNRIPRNLSDLCKLLVTCTETLYSVWNNTVSVDRYQYGYRMETNITSVDMVELRTGV